MADYNEIPAAQILHKAGVGQDFMTIVRDDFINHQDRILGLEQQVLTFEHFNFRELVTQNVPPPGFVENSAVTSTGFSVLTLNTTIGNFASLQTSRLFLYSNVTKPLTLFCRLKKLQDGDTRVGLRIFQNPSLSSLPGDARGIWLERVDASNWRFVSYDTARNNGTGFAKPSDGTWFTVEIEFTDTPSDRALCRVDGVLKETLTTQIPTGAGELHALVGATAPASGNVMDVDKISYGAVSLGDAA